MSSAMRGEFGGAAFSSAQSRSASDRKARASACDLPVERQGQQLLEVAASRC